MGGFRFVHAADLRLDRPWQGIGRTSPDVAEALTSAAVEAWDGLVRLAVERQAVCLLLAGGVGYATPYVQVRQKLVEGLRQLANHNIPVFVLRDEESGDVEWWRSLVEAGGGRIFHPASEPAAVVAGGLRVATVYGPRPPAAPAPGVGRHPLHRANLGLRIALRYVPAAEDAEAHRTMDSPEGLAEYGVDYWALGGRDSYHASGAPPWIVHSGALQSRTLEPDEAAPKGAVVVECQDGRIEQVTFQALDRIRAFTIHLDAAGLSDREALWHALVQQGNALRLQHEGRSLVVAAAIVNVARSQSWLQETELEDLLERLRRTTDRSAGQFLWWDSLQAETVWGQRPHIAGDFGSAVARAVEQVRQDPDRLRVAIRGRAWQMEERVRAHGFDDGDSTVVLARAEQLVARFLTDEGAEQ